MSSASSNSSEDDRCSQESEDSDGWSIGCDDMIGCDDLCFPFQDACRCVLTQTCDCFDDMQKRCSDWLCSDKDFCLLCFCGCCLIIVPLYTFFLAIAAVVIVFELCVMAIVGSIWGLSLVLIGIWPAFLYSLGVAFVAVIRIPVNMFYHIKVTYRTVCLRTDLKVINISLTPIVHLIIPIVVICAVIIGSLVVCFFVSFFGNPCTPWRELRNTFDYFWKLYVTNIEEFVANYGHASGVPESWDGKVYGLPIDPITLLIGLFLLIYGLVVVTLMQCALLLVKALPIYIWILKRCCETCNICAACEMYAETISSYARVDVCQHYYECIKSYFGCRPTKLMPTDCCACFILSWLIVLGTITWCICWLFVLLLPPIIYVLNWFVIILCPPLCYILFWICAVVGPWVALLLAIASGPLLSLRVPYVALRHNLNLPGQLCRSVNFGLKEPCNILRSTDSWTADFCLGNWMLCGEDSRNHGSPQWRADFESVQHVKYWDLFIARCKQTAVEAVRKNWIAKEDVEAMSPNVMIAVPGLAILDILVTSIREEEDDLSLIYCDESNQCNENTRNMADNISNHYWPLLLKVKTSIREFLEDGTELEQEAWYIAAKLCSGECEQSRELIEAMEKYHFEDAKTIKLNRCCAEVTDIVLSLLRTQEMQRRFASVGTSLQFPV